MRLHVVVLAAVAALALIGDAGAQASAMAKFDHHGDKGDRRFLRVDTEKEEESGGIKTNAVDDEERVMPSMATSSKKVAKIGEESAVAALRWRYTPRTYFRVLELENLPRTDPKWLMYSKFKEAYKLKNPKKFKKSFKPKREPILVKLKTTHKLKEA